MGLKFGVWFARIYRHFFRNYLTQIVIRPVVAISGITTNTTWDFNIRVYQGQYKISAITHSWKASCVHSLFSYPVCLLPHVLQNFACAGTSAEQTLQIFVWSIVEVVLS